MKNILDSWHLNIFFTGITNQQHPLQPHICYSFSLSLFFMSCLLNSYSCRLPMLSLHKCLWGVSHCRTRNAASHSMHNWVQQEHIVWLWEEEKKRRKLRGLLQFCTLCSLRWGHSQAPHYTSPQPRWTGNFHKKMGSSSKLEHREKDLRLDWWSNMAQLH